MAKNELELLLDLSKQVDGVQKDVTNVRTDVYNIDKTLMVQAVQLENHMKRTELNEERLEIFEEAIKPALDAYKFIETLLKATGVVVVFVGTVVAIWFQIKG